MISEVEGKDELLGKNRNKCEYDPLSLISLSSFLSIELTTVSRANIGNLTRRKREREIMKR